MGKEKSTDKTGLFRRWKNFLPLLLLLFAVILNVIGWKSTNFCNAYVKHIFPLWVEIYGRFTGLFPFSVGEWLLYLSVLLLLSLAAGGIVLFLLMLLSRPKENESVFKWRKAFGRSYKNYFFTVYFIFSIVCVVMTLNCFLLYHVSPINERYDIGGDCNRNYGFEEIAVLRDYVVVKANALAPLMERDERGYLTYSGDLKAESKKQMKKLGERYDALSGYYPDPKGFLFSEFFSQQYIMGYYFPFSMEANYNTRMYIVNMPVTMCHELSHLKGFILEDEANFIGYLACVDSDELLFQYSAYLSVINYLDRDFLKAAGKNMEIYLSHPMIDMQVLEDKKFLTPEEWDEVEKKAVLDTEVVKQASDKFVNTNLTLNGVADGKISYSRVVNLLLQYYDGRLYECNSVAKN